jgi:glycosyltransferase involved in cell wall biosynthesis
LSRSIPESKEPSVAGHGCGPTRRRPVLLFLVPEDWYFYSHRFGLACAARDAGFDVVVMTHLTRFGPELERAGLRTIAWESGRNSLNPLRKVRSLMAIGRAYREVRPDLVHHVALEPVVWGGIVARMLDIPCVSAIAGLGHVFTEGGARNRMARPALMTLLRWVMRRRNARTIFQTSAQRDLLVAAGALAPENSAVIRGVGADLETFTFTPEDEGVPVVMLACRLLWLKGVAEFVAAAKQVREEGIHARFVLVGTPDAKNPASIPEAQIAAWEKEGAIEYWGGRDDMPAVLRQCHVFCFPSYYGEGVPKVLIEAAASGRAIIATSIAGCAEVVQHEENGLLVAPRDVPALVAAIRGLLADPGRRRRMGARGREIAEARFAERQAVAGTFQVYRSLVGERWPGTVTEAPGERLAVSVSTR